MLPHQTPELEKVWQELPLLLHPRHLAVPVILVRGRTYPRPRCTLPFRLLALDDI